MIQFPNSQLYIPHRAKVGDSWYCNMHWWRNRIIFGSGTLTCTNAWCLGKSIVRVLTPFNFPNRLYISCLYFKGFLCLPCTHLVGYFCSNFMLIHSCHEHSNVPQMSKKSNKRGTLEWNATFQMLLFTRMHSQHCIIQCLQRKKGFFHSNIMTVFYVFSYKSDKIKGPTNILEWIQAKRPFTLLFGFHDSKMWSFNFRYDILAINMTNV